MWGQPNKKQGGGKGQGGKGDGNLQNMEAQLATKAWSFYERILHLDIAMPQLSQEWGQIASLRTNILSAYGINTPMGTTAPSGGMAALADANPEGDNWKGKLQQHLSKKLGKSMVKGEIVYQVADAEGGGFMASCASAHLAQEYHSEKAEPSKRAAEAAAALAAFKAEFPQAYGVSVGTIKPKGQKRKADALDAQPLDPKSRLNQAISLLLGRPCTKNDTVFETTETGGTFSGSLKVPDYDAQVFKIANKESKKAAEVACAELALKKWNAKLTKIEAEHKAKKAEQNKERLAALKAAQAEKKAKKEATA